MGTHFRAGFTIIETMLVLAITGALVTGIFIGIGASINQQRYRDSVDSLKNTLQSQYAELTSVQNDRPNNWSCDALAQTSQATTETRGQSDCVLLGRLVTIDATDMKIYTVVGRESASSTGSVNDITALRDDYVMNVSSVTVEDTKLEWGAQISWPQTGGGARTPTTPRQLSLLFIRSPVSGQVYTFTGDTVPSTLSTSYLRSLVVAGDTIPGQGSRIICVDGSGLGITDAYLLELARYAAVPNSVETSTNQIIQQSGRTTRC